MPPNLIDEEYCPECTTMLDLIGRNRDDEYLIERYYCGRCRDERILHYELRESIKE